MFLLKPGFWIVLFLGAIFSPVILGVVLPFFIEAFFGVVLPFCIEAFYYIVEVVRQSATSVDTK